MADKGSIIKKLREGADMAQEQLAQKLDVTKQTIFKYEKNIITNIPSDKIEQLADIFGVSPLVILGRKSIDEDNLCKFDQRLIDAYHAADPSTQKVIRIMLKIEK